jgi:hypothetical protein
MSIALKGKVAICRWRTDEKLLSPLPRSGLFYGLQDKSPENGSFLGFGRRLSGIFGRKSADAGLRRLSTIRKARIWRAFLVKKRKFS